jgi:hypothetical protein
MNPCEVCGAPCRSKHLVCKRTPECARERKRREAKASRDANPGRREKERAYSREYRQDHPEQVRAYRANYVQGNLEQVRAYNSGWSRQHRQDNAEQIRAHRQAYYRDNREQVLERNTGYRTALRSTVPGAARLMFLGARARARKGRLPFDLTAEWVESELVSALENGCPLLGIKITLNTGRRLSASPSIDKFRPELGYVQDNCWVVSWAANAMKHDMPIDFVREVVATGTPDFLQCIVEAADTRFAVGGAVWLRVWAGRRAST